MIEYVEKFRLVGLFLNGEVVWIWKETTLIYFSGTALASTHLIWRVNTNNSDLFVRYYSSVCAAQLKSEYQ